MFKQELIIGKTGLMNLGNTCFINSTIQILRNTVLLNSFFDTNNYEIFMKNNLPESIIFNEWNILRKLMNDQSVIVSPKRFVYQVQHVAKIKKCNLFTNFSQNDLTEFLLFIIDSLHICVSRSIKYNVVKTTDIIEMSCNTMLKNNYKIDYSEIMDIFFGVLISEILSIDGKKIHCIKPEQYFTLDLEIPLDTDNTSIYECLNEFTCSEILDDENAWFNEKTNKKEDVQKRIRFWNFPNVLIITLKRFTYDRQKINTFVDYPIKLDLTNYACGNNPSQYIYNLYGICLHYGTPDYGHYVSIVKHNNEWVQYNDEQIQIIQPENIILRQAYCLFYQKCYV